MSESFKTPIVGEHVNSGAAPQQQPQPTAQERPTSGFSNGRYVPPTGKPSLHDVRLPRSQQAEIAPVWVDNPRGQGGRFEYRPVERQTEPTPATAPPQSAQPNDALTQQVGQLTNAVTLMLQHQLGLPEDTGPRMPDPSQFFFDDPQEEGEYHKRLEEYVQARVQERLQSEFEPYRGALDNVKQGHDIQSQVEQLVSEHGDTPKFRRTLSAAIELVADSGNTLPIREAFDQADNPDNARPGVRGNAHRPKQLKGLGQIMQHNVMTGRSKPFGGRNWKG